MHLAWYVVIFQALMQSNIWRIFFPHTEYIHAFLPHEPSVLTVTPGVHIAKLQIICIGNNKLRYPIPPSVPVPET